MRQIIHGSQVPDRARTGEILLAGLCKIGKSDAPEICAICRVRQLRQAIQEVPSRDNQESRRQTLLLTRLLVLLQPTRQSLSLDRRTARPAKSRRYSLAQGCTQAGQTSLSNLSRHQASRSSSHLPIWYSSRSTLGNRQWDHALPQLPYWFQKKGTGLHRNFALYSQRTYRGVVC